MKGDVQLPCFTHSVKVIVRSATFAFAVHNNDKILDLREKLVPIVGHNSFSMSLKSFFLSDDLTFADLDVIADHPMTLVAEWNEDTI